jgi:hypothetical protein
MAIYINFLSNFRISFDFKGNRPTISALSDGPTRTRISEEDDQNDNARRISDTPSTKTFLDDSSNFSHLKHIRWIAGVGDIFGPGDWTNESPCSAICKPVGTSLISRNTVPQQPMKLLKPQHFRQSCDHTRSALQRHCDFWDTDSDNLIYPWDIFRGFQKLGFHFILCLWAAVTMALAASYSTHTSWVPHPLFAINLNNINSNRHGSSTGTYDMDGNLDRHRFDAIFEKYAQGKDYLTLWSTYKIWRNQRCGLDFFGWFAGGLECKCLTLVIMMFKD